MRQRRFKAWDTEEKHWDNHPGRLSMGLIVDGQGDHFHVGAAAKRLEIVEGTGYEDIDGKHVYDGQILSFPGTAHQRYEVRYNEIEGSWNVFYKDMPVYKIGIVQLMITVGTRQENPELLK